MILEKKIAAIIEDHLSSIGFDLVMIKIHNTSRPIIEILIDRLSSDKITINDCKQASKLISKVLEEKDFIDGKYNLEISSAGVERPLVKLRDYVKFTGSSIKMKFKIMHEDLKSFTGVIQKVDNEKIIISNCQKELIVNFENIKSANLIFDDKFFKSLLNQSTN